MERRGQLEDRFLTPRRRLMPRVGKKHFSYSKAGRAAAKAYAKKTGGKTKTKKAKK